MPGGYFLLTESFLKYLFCLLVCKYVSIFYQIKHLLELNVGICAIKSNMNLICLNMLVNQTWTLVDNCINLDVPLVDFIKLESDFPGCRHICVLSIKHKFDLITLNKPGCRYTCLHLSNQRVHLSNQRV